MSTKQTKANPLVELINKFDKKILILWATDCAKHVLPNFEKKYPKDKRPRIAIQTGKAWANDLAKTSEARAAAFSAHTAARATKDQIAKAVARSAGQAVATAHVAGHAIHAANYAAQASKNPEKERDWQFKRLLLYYKKNFKIK